MAARSSSIARAYRCHSSTKPEGRLAAERALLCVKKTRRKARNSARPGTRAVGVPCLMFARSQPIGRPVSPRVLSLVPRCTAARHLPFVCQLSSRASLCPPGLYGASLVVMHRTADIAQIPGTSPCCQPDSRHVALFGGPRRITPEYPLPYPDGGCNEQSFW
jgi:hypothetical protein